jgi:membrane protease YdiL (CAAX protease family)
MSQTMVKNTENIKLSETENGSEYSLKSVSMRTSAVDLLFVLLTLFTIKTALLQFSSLWTYAGPISLLASLAVATWRLKRSNHSWSDVGFIHDMSHLKLAGWTLLALVVTLIGGGIAESVATSLISEPSIDNEALTSTMQDRFANVAGNIPVYLFWIAISWGIGGFVEELLFRGFLINRFESLFQRLPFAVIYGVLIQAAIFGQQHYYYQGMNGLIATGVIGLLSGIIYITCGRRLWPLILSHGLANTLGMTMLFLGTTQT